MQNAKYAAQFSLLVHFCVSRGNFTQFLFISKLSAEFETENPTVVVFRVSVFA